MVWHDLSTASEMVSVTKVYTCIMKNDYLVLKTEIIRSPVNGKHELVDATVKTPDGKEVVWQYVKT